MQGAEVPPIRTNIYNVPMGCDFCDATVMLAIDRAKRQARSLSDTILFLPNNRAIKAMTEAFVRQAAPGLLLPRMVAIGDLALDESVGSLLDPITDDEMLWPVIDPMRRLLLVHRLVIKHRASDLTLSSTEALRLARKLIELIDELEIEQVPYERFSDISVDVELAGHWQKSYGKVLDILPAYYAQLNSLELLGPSQRRNLLLDRLIGRLGTAGFDGSVMAAGITTSAPAVVRVLSRIAKLPNGCVMLHGVDLEMAQPQWEALGPRTSESDASTFGRNQEAHPQFHLKLLLDRMGVGRDEVQNTIGLLTNTRSLQITDIFCLPSDTTKWRDSPPVRKRMPTVSLLEAPDISTEARAIAIAMRESLEIVDQRIALVTPDRELAMRVATQLRRWNINVDDSAGTPVLQTPPGKLIKAIAEAVASNFSPVSILALAKHPLIHAGESRLAWLERTRALDLALRGPPEGAGLSAIEAAIRKNAKNDEALAGWWQEFLIMLSPLSGPAGAPLATIMSALQQTADSLTNGNIWKGVAGRHIAQIWEDILACDLAAIELSDRSEIPAILTELFGSIVVRPPYGGHPRLAIYGLLEARLQQADIVICSGLNEGSWPQVAQPDPWLAPAIRRHLGLATLDRNVGLSAHDLATALGAHRAFLTRARRDRSGPTVASRFVLRMKAFLGKNLSANNVHAALAAHIDAPDQPIEFNPQPAPKPTAKQRKVTLSVTDFDQLKSDPYSFYAKKVLGLRVLDAVNADPGFAWRGTLVHEILEKWFTQDDGAPEALLARAEALLSNKALNPALRALWQPRVAEGLRWIAEETQRMQAGGRHCLVAEKAGHVELLGVRVKGRVDRIDLLPDGGLVIIDYKTGLPPKPKQINAGFALQLGLIGLIAESGAIAGASGKAARFEYWSLAKNKQRGFGYVATPNSAKPNDKFPEPEDFLAFVKQQAEAAIGNWIIGDAPFVAKLHPDFANYGDYDHLMRLQEWDGRQALADSDADA
jgi:ATP-dependent helicase/nuclease subunit B